MKTRNQIPELGCEQRFFTGDFHHNHLVRFMNLPLLKIYGVSILELWGQAELLKNSSLLIWMPNDPGDPLIYSSGFKTSFILPSIFKKKKNSTSIPNMQVFYLFVNYIDMYFFMSGPRVSCCHSAPRFPLTCPFLPGGVERLWEQTREPCITISRF